MPRCCICHRLSWCIELEDGRSVCSDTGCLRRAGCGDLLLEIRRYLEFVALARA